MTWCGVRGFDSTQTTTVQASLLPSGTVDVKFGPEVTLGEAIVALSPGRGGSLTPVDLSAAGRRSGGASAVGERFSDEAELDTAQTARRFYASHPDRFDQLVFWTDTTVVSDAFAFESTVSNAIRGLGSQTFNQSADFGSAGTLESVMVMDRVAKYGDDPNAKILGENSALAVVAHETGHRWLTQFLFRNGSQGNSDALLGRQRAHWSFFFDSDASVMEGNDIEDLRGGSFRTIAAAERYSRLDLYGMGLVPARDVPSFFYVDAPTNVSPSRDRESAPRVGVTFNGTRRDLADPGRHRRQRRPPAERGWVAEGPPSGLDLRDRARHVAVGRGPDPPRSPAARVRAVLPPDHREPDDADDGAELTWAQGRGGPGAAAGGGRWRFGNFATTV